MEPSKAMLEELTAGFKTPQKLEGLYTQMLQHMVNRALEADMQAHLGHERHCTSAGNVRNKNRKTVQSAVGDVQVESRLIQRDSTMDARTYREETAYDTLGRAWKSRDASGHWTEQEFDARGFATKTCASTAADTTPTCGSTFYTAVEQVDACGAVTLERRGSSAGPTISRSHNVGPAKLLIHLTQWTEQGSGISPPIAVQPRSSGAVHAGLGAQVQRMRVVGSIGHIPPAEAETAYHRHLLLRAHCALLRRTTTIV